MKEVYKNVISHEMGSILIDKRIIHEIRYYVDSKKLYDQYNELIDESHSCAIELSFLLKILSSPIMLDKIEGKLSSDREAVRNQVHNLGREIYYFYETNRLNSSNMANAFTFVELILETGYVISPSLYSKMCEIKYELSGGSKSPVQRYRNVLDNAGRLQMVYKLQDFLEYFLIDIFNQIRQE